jgi:hypothetical protein
MPPAVAVHAHGGTLVGNFPPGGFVAARHAPEEHPVTFELQQRVVAVKPAQRLPHSVEQHPDHLT